MPGIVLFGRRWMAASDGLVFTFGTSVILRVAWFVLICIIFGIHSAILRTGAYAPPAEEECKGKVHIYLLGYITFLAVISIIECLLCFTSSRGKIFEVHKRQAIVPLLYVRFTLFIIELTWQLLGFIWIFSNEVLDNCQSMPTKRLAKGVVIFNFLFMIGIFVVVYFAFDSAGRLWPKMQSSGDRKSRYGAIDNQIRTHYEKKWEKSLRSLFCCTKKESSMENVFAFVSSLLSDYFQEYLDLVPSDIVAGLILLRRRQKVMESRDIRRLLSETDGNEKVAESSKKACRSVHRYQKTSSAKSFDFSNMFDTKILEDVSHFSLYALAIYGWPFYIYDRIICGACNLCCKIRCCAGCCRTTKKDFLLVEDNCCECNIEATKLYLKDRDHELIFVSYKDEVYQPPFFVALDHKKKAVVISCRGTLSLKDVLTDVMVEEERIPVEDGQPNWMGHKGMIQSAQYVLEILDKEEILHKAFNANTERNTQSYKLTVVGHSLGAGVASILAFLLRPKYPDLICYAYSAVGATFNYDASKYARDFIYSIVVGKDVISRLNLHTLDELRYMVIRLLHCTNLPKWKIMRGCLCQCMLCCQATGRRSHEDYADYEFHDIPEYEPSSSKRYYMGGKVIHIVKTKSIYPKYFGEKKAVYEAVWADVEDFQSILISNLMWKDHVPDTVKQALESCVSHLCSSNENGGAKEPEKSQGNSKNNDQPAKMEEKVRLLDDGEDEEESFRFESTGKREDMTVEAESATTDEVLKEGVVHSAEVCVEIHTQNDAKHQDAFANEEVIENKPEGISNFEGKTDNESQNEVIKEHENGEDNEKTGGSFEIVISTDHVESSLGKEEEIKGSFEIIDVVVRSGDDVKPGDIANQEGKETAEDGTKPEEKGIPFHEAEAGNESNSFDDDKNVGVTADAVNDGALQEPLTEKETRPANDVIEPADAESLGITRGEEETSANGTTDDVKSATVAVPEFDVGSKDEGKEVEAMLSEEGLSEIKVPAEIISVSEDTREEGEKENPEIQFNQEVIAEVTPAMVARNETIVTIETTAADESDFIILENDPQFKNTSSTEQIEISVVDVKIITDNEVEKPEEIA